MPRDWQRYIFNSNTDAGRAIVEQGRRIFEARQALPEERYLEILSKGNITPRDARMLTSIGRRLSPVLDANAKVKLPFRIRTLTYLADLSIDTLLNAAESGRLHSGMNEAEARALRGSATHEVPPVIRPTDNWNFSTLRWPRIDGWDGHGYIPGDLYANCIWYYAHEGDTVVDPMAGSGMLLKVWEERADWAEDESRDIEIKLSDLVPRGPYAHKIRHCDLINEVPVDDADYVIIDPPYCGLTPSQYSDLPNDLANMDPNGWTEAMRTIAGLLRTTQPEGGRCTVIVPNSRTITTGERILFPEIVRRLFQEVGYHLYDVVYASRRTQQRQGRQMAVLNNRARRERVPMSDISEVLTFINPLASTQIPEISRNRPKPLARL